MPQDFSGQKLYGRSFVGQDLQEANFAQVKTGRTWFSSFLFYVGVFIISLFLGIMLLTTAFWFANAHWFNNLYWFQIIDMLLKGITYISTNNYYTGLIPIFWVINISIFFFANSDSYK